MRITRLKMETMFEWNHRKKIRKDAVITLVGEQKETVTMPQIKIGRKGRLG